jgi:large subunit ribosomal protein L15
MPLHRRLPKRGFSNARFRQEYQIVNLKQIAKLEETIIDPQLLYQKGMIHSALKPVKILAEGDLKKAVEVSATAFSTSAKEKIEAAGGTATVL